MHICAPAHIHTHACPHTYMSLRRTLPPIGPCSSIARVHCGLPQTAVCLSHSLCRAWQYGSREEFSLTGRWGSQVQASSDAWSHHDTALPICEIRAARWGRLCFTLANIPKTCILAQTKKKTTHTQVCVLKWRNKILGLIQTNKLHPLYSELIKGECPPALTASGSNLFQVCGAQNVKSVFLRSALTQGSNKITQCRQ